MEKGHSTAYPFTASGLIGPATSSMVVITGITFAETGGTAVGFVRLRQGSVTGKIIGSFSCPASGGVSPCELPHVRCDGQLYVQVVTGTVEGDVFIR